MKRFFTIIFILSCGTSLKAQIPTQLPEKNTTSAQTTSQKPTRPLQGVAVIEKTGVYGPSLRAQMAGGFLSTTLSQVYQLSEKSPRLGVIGDIRLFKQPFSSAQSTSVPQFSPYGLFAFDKNTFMVGRWDFLQGGAQNHSTEQPGDAVLDVLYLEKWIHPLFRVRAGHQRLPIGRYNLNDDPDSFLSIDRPEVESHLIPGPWHDTGVLAWGVHPKGWSYHLGAFHSLNGNNFTDTSFLRNGRRQGDSNKGEDILGVFRFDWTKGNVLLGGTYLRGETDQNEGNLDQAQLILWDIHLTYQRGPFRWSSIYTEAQLDESHKINGAGNQPGRRAAGYSTTLGVDMLPFLSPTAKYHWIWFAQYTEYNLHADTESIVAAKDSLHKIRTTLGWNWKQDNAWVVKAQYQYRKNKEDQESDAYEISLGFKF